MVTRWVFFSSVLVGDGEMDMARTIVREVQYTLCEALVLVMLMPTYAVENA